MKKYEYVYLKTKHIEYTIVTVTKEYKAYIHLGIIGN